MSRTRRNFSPQFEKASSVFSDFKEDSLKEKLAAERKDNFERCHSAIRNILPAMAHFPAVLHDAAKESTA